MACLDTTVFVDATGRNASLKGRSLAKVRDLIRRGQTLVTTRFNVAELYVGVFRSDDRRSEELSVLRMLRGLAILDFDGKAMKLFGQITALLQQSGLPVGDMDVLIAATAMAHGHLLVTRNPEHFRRIPNLSIQEY